MKKSKFTKEEIEKFGEEFLKMMKPLQSFESACKIESLNPDLMPTFEMFPKKDRPHMIAHAKLVVMTRAANRLANGGKEWIPDYSNYNEIKYEPWAYLSEGSSGFRLDDFGAWFSDSGVGSRLCFISRDVFEYMRYKFIEIFKDFYL